MKIELKEKTFYEVHSTSDFKKGLKKLQKQNKDMSKLEKVVLKLANNEELEPKYNNHKLKNDKYYKDCGECHIEPDWLLIYRYSQKELILLLVNTGSHSELFGK